MKKRIGIIDIGSNSMRLLLAEIEGKNSFRIINELKEYVRLGDGLDGNAILSQQKIDLAIDTLKTYKNICSSFEVSEITVVATEAVRRAKNQAEFLSRAKNEANVEITVLSGEKEAYYDYFSTINSMNINNALIMDIGGASTELILVKNRKLINCISFPFGAITLTDHFNLSDAIDKNKEKKLIDYILQYFNSIKWLSQAKGFDLIGIGGSIRTLGKIHRKSLDYPLNLIHNYKITNNDIFSIYNDIKVKNSTQRKKIKGLSSDRADIIVGAAAAISALVETYPINNVIISRNGIREGVLYSYICENKKPLDDILNFSLSTILVNHNSNIPHAKHVYHLTTSLVKDLKSIINCNKNLDNVIKTAALLHDIGTNITRYFHHKHSLYMILNSQINGLTHKELVMSACIAASHRDDNLINYNDYNLVINKDDVDIIKKLGVLLKISESLDKSMTCAVKNISCNIDENTVIIKTISESVPKLEIKEASTISQDFKKVFDKKLYIV